MSNTKVDFSQFAALVAIDWADQKHFWSLQTPDGPRQRGSVDSWPEAIEVWAAELMLRFSNRPIAVAMEQSRGALAVMLQKYEAFVLFPVDPGSLARYRKIFCPSGAKDDPVDADLLLDLLLRHGEHLRPLKPDTISTRTLQFLSEDRRCQVDEKTRHTHRLRDRLKLCFPQVVQWFGDELDSEMVGDLLLRWPTLQRLQKARPDTLRRFFRQHNCRKLELIEERLRQIPQATPATEDKAVLDTAATFVCGEVEVIAALRRTIKEMEKSSATEYAQHEDAPIFDSLPGAGPALAPRLLVAFGTDRTRYQSASEIQRYSGIAPVTERSGKHCWVHYRWACPKFLRQTFHEWALHSMGKSEWARSFYLEQRAKGLGHHAAVRSLAFKWIRILFRCWQTRTPYSEARYQDALRKRRQPHQTGAHQWKTCGDFFKVASGNS